MTLRHADNLVTMESEIDDITNVDITNLLSRLSRSQHSNNNELMNSNVPPI